MDKDESVLLRAYGGKPIVGRIIAEDNGYGGVQVCERENPARDFGWPRAYVFVYDEALANKLKSSYEAKSNRLEDYWDEAELYLTEFR